MGTKAETHIWQKVLCKKPNNKKEVAKYREKCCYKAVKGWTDPVPGFVKSILSLTKGLSVWRNAGRVSLQGW